MMDEVLPVGDPARPAIGRAVLGSLLLAAIFVLFAWSVKELPSLGSHAPWQDDPYDTAVSFAIFFLPLLCALGALRLPLCRRALPLPLQRAADLLRLSRLLVIVVGITLAGDWASVVLGAHRGTWTVATTAPLVGLLTVLTALAAVIAWQVRRVSAARLGQASEVPGPDWLADAVTVANRTGSRLGPAAAGALFAVRWIDLRIIPTVRRRPLGTAILLSSLFGASVAASQAREVGLGFAPINVLFFGVSSSGMFAFLVAVGAYVRLLGPAPAPGQATRAMLIASSTVPVTLAFRDSLWWIIGTNARDAGLPQLAVVIVIVAVAAAALSAAAALVSQRRLHRERYF